MSALRSLPPLWFRRQYIITNQNNPQFKTWQTCAFEDNTWFVYAHPDIEISYAKQNNKEIILIGFLLSPDNPTATNQSIIAELLQKENFDDVLKATFRLGGRFILIYKDAQVTRLFQDTLSFREVYYHQKEEKFWAAAQPTLLQEWTPLIARTDKKILDFLNSPLLNMKSKGWYGDESLYEAVYHLLPNHYLDLNTWQAVRYWLNPALTIVDKKDTFQPVSAIMSGLLANAVYRYPTLVALTAGIDSRIILAATRRLKDSLVYFVNRYPKMTPKTADIRIPTLLSKKLGLQFNVVELPKVNEIPEDFVQAYQNNYLFVAGDRLGQQVHYSFLKNFDNRLNVMGLGSEIVRTFYPIEGEITGEALAEVCHYQKIPFMIEQCERWLATARPFAEKYNLSLKDLFYWENRMGNRGATVNTRADIARETVSLYNCREVLLTFMAVKVKDRQYPEHILYKEFIKNLWMEAYQFPINPPDNMREFIRNQVQKAGLFGLYQRIAKYMKG